MILYKIIDIYKHEKYQLELIKQYILKLIDLLNYVMKLKKIDQVNIAAILKIKIHFDESFLNVIK